MALDGDEGFAGLALRLNIWPKGGDISVGPYSSTAPPVMTMGGGAVGRDGIGERNWG